MVIRKETWFDGLEHSSNIGVNKQRRYQKPGPTTVKKGCEVMFSLYSLKFLYLSDDSRSHQSFPSFPFKAAKLNEKHRGLLRHSKMQSKMSYTANESIRVTFR